MTILPVGISSPSNNGLSFPSPRYFTARSQECLRYVGAERSIAPLPLAALGASRMTSPKRADKLPALGGGVEARAAAAGGEIGHRRKSGLELAFGEELESAHAIAEFEGGQAALAIEFAQEIVGGALALL